MDNNKKAIIAIGVLILLAGGTWYLTKPKKTVKDKAYWMKNIVTYKLGKAVADTDLESAESTIKTYEDGYLKAWSDAIDSNSGSFVYNNVTYMTIDGHTPTR
jgi:hypothetical protein